MFKVQAIGFSPIRAASSFPFISFTPRGAAYSLVYLVGFGGIWFGVITLIWWASSLFNFPHCGIYFPM